MIRRVLEAAGTGLVLAGVAFGCLAQTQPTQSNSPQVTSQTTASLLTATETAQARAWDLTETEWRRYKTLMQGIRGRLSPDLSPVETLGIHARTRQERDRYAERWAEALRQDTERVLAFQRAYDAAWRRLHGDEPLIDLTLLPDRPSSTRRRPATASCSSPARTAHPAAPRSRSFWPGCDRSPIWVSTSIGSAASATTPRCAPGHARASSRPSWSVHAA